MLAPFAMRSSESRGRDHDEPEEFFRSAFQRDRDRIVHSTAFRRLEYKTQVFVNHEGDHYRTRLTHTIEVAQISRTVARALSLNEDLVEAIALSHDLGHPPFGHAGEDKLDELMEHRGGFNHNRHSLRVVEELEKRYPDFPGLNLSWEIRESIAKHYGRFEEPSLQRFDPDGLPLLEAQLADIGDSLAYDTHDLDDGLRSGYIHVDELRSLEIWQEAEERVRERWPQIDERRRIARSVSRLIDAQVQDLIVESKRRIAESGVRSVEDVRAAKQPLIAFSKSMAGKKRKLEQFLRANLYQHYRSKKIAEKGKRFIEAIFLEYLREPGQLPGHHRRRIESEGVERVICDYLAGMTDRFCLQEYMRLFVPFADGGIAGSL
ncbi:MAG: deoxyguanosinetriphosphate triphosphohydrolase [Planctomycetota bacterium]